MRAIGRPEGVRLVPSDVRVPPGLRYRRSEQGKQANQQIDHRKSRLEAVAKQGGNEGIAGVSELQNIERENRM
jgi:hypothetical protein